MSKRKPGAKPTECVDARFKDDQLVIDAAMCHPELEGLEPYLKVAAVAALRCVSDVGRLRDLLAGAANGDYRTDQSVLLIVNVLEQIGRAWRSRVVNGQVVHSRLRPLIARWAAGRKEPFVAPDLMGLVDPRAATTAHATAFELADVVVDRVKKAGKRLKDVELPDVSALAGQIVHEAWQAATANGPLPPNVTRPTKRQRIILAALPKVQKKHPAEPVTAELLASEAGSPNNSAFRNELSQMVKLGFLRKTCPGYALPPQD